MRDEPYDVVVVGAGAAGLQAALTLGRMRLRTAVLGTDRYRNDPTEHMHNFLGHDGDAPATLREAARRDVAAYPSVELLDREATEIAGEVGAFTVRLADGGVLRAARVILAAGFVDELPDVDGLPALFGSVVAHCPYCHGYEYADRPVGLLAGPASAHLGRVMERIASRLVVFTDGADLDDDVLAALKRDERQIVTTPISSLEPSELGLIVRLADGSSEELGGMIVKTTPRPATSFTEQLGVEVSPMGAALVDAMGRTSVPGVYAAGDLAQFPGQPMPMASVIVAAAGGLLAAAGCHQDTLLAERPAGA